MIELRAVRARDGEGPHGRARGRLHGLDLALAPGVHAVLGRPEDGLMALVDVVSGRSRPSSGTVRVAGADPARSARLRARMGTLGVRPALPEGATVATVMAWACASRRSASEPLELLGLAALAPRPVRSLSLGEARAVELCMALAVAEPCALVVYEPLCDLAVPERSAVTAALRGRAAEGACVLLATSSVADATELADQVHLLRQGRVVGPSPLAASARGGARELVLWVDPRIGGGARALGSALGGRAELAGVGWQLGAASGAPELVAVRANELELAAVAVAEECSRLGVAVLALDSSPPPLEQLMRDAWWQTVAPAASAAPPASPILTPEAMEPAPRAIEPEPRAPGPTSSVPADEEQQR